MLEVLEGSLIVDVLQIFQRVASERMFKISQFWWRYEQEYSISFL